MENTEEKIMSKIRSGKVKLRSKYIFLAEKLGLESAFALSVILSVLFSNLFFFYLKATDNLEYLSFGSEGIYAFLESFPYLLVMAFVIFVLIAGYILSKIDFLYKKPFKYFAASLVAFVLVSGGVLAYTEIPERIENEAFNKESSGSIIKPFLKRGVETRRNGLSGKIFETGNDYFIIEMPNGYQRVDVKKIEYYDRNLFSNGQFVVILGKRNEDVFEAKKIKTVSEDRIQMIRRGIRRSKFESEGMGMENGFIMQRIELKECMDGCLILSEFRRQCFDDCLKQ